MLRKYTGARVHEHFGDAATPHSVRKYARYEDEVTVYHFNALGFRACSPTTPDTSRLFVAGCSYTMGIGLQFEETWPYLFARERARANGRGEPEVMNFAQGGASNAYIAQTLLSQCAAQRPELVLALFSHVNRTEYYLAPEERGLTERLSARGSDCVGSVSVAPQMALGWFARRVASRTLPASFRGIAALLTRWATLYYRGVYRETAALADSVLQMLALQLYCQVRGIDHCFSFVDHRMLSEPRFTSHSVIGPLIELLDRKRLVDFSILDPDVYVDLARDRSHPGVESNKLFASRLWIAAEAAARSPNGASASHPSAVQA